MLIENKKLTDLIPADYNPRKDLKPGDDEYEKLKRSIEQFGMVQPVIWNKTTGRGVGGHQRLKVLADMGYAETECVVVEMDEAQEKALNIALNKITPQKLIEQSNVTHLFTTNEIFDDLSTFVEIAKKDYKFKVIPAFRADKIMNIEAAPYNDFIAKLGEVKDLTDLEEKIEQRLNEFIKVGTTASDIAVQSVYPVSEKKDAEKVFAKRIKGENVTEEESIIFKGYLTYFLFKLYAKYNIATELHVGAMRNNNTVMLNKLGLDTGYDSIAEDNSIKYMSRLFDRLNNENSLPKTIVFNLNPKMNSEIMTLIGSFQSDEARGKLQYGPAWWFLDNKVGMEKHLEDLTATGHIGAFVGMLTDSRSLLSYPRHHYFRRILCNYLGTMMENGQMTTDENLVGKVIKDVCYNNAINYLRMN